MTNHVTYQLGARQTFSTKTGPILVTNTKTLEGALAWASDEKRGDYVRVYEVGPTEWVQDEPQAWSTGNFMSVKDAQHFASKAYRWINRGALSPHPYDNRPVCKGAEEPAVMTSDEYRTAYSALGLTQAGIARLLGVDERTSRRWATGEREVPPPVARFLTFLVVSEITADEVMGALSDGANDAD